MKNVKSVEEFLEEHWDRKDELELLRKLLVDTEMDECIKWRIPVYTLSGKNVVGIGCFKKYVGLWFHQGVFLSDTHKMLVNAQEEKTKALRQWRFQTLDEIKKLKPLIKAYILEAIENQRQGLEVKANRTKKKIVIPPLLKNELTGNLLSCFEKLSDYKKKEYCDYILDAKQEKTKLRRLDKILPMIKTGIGLSDKYRKG